MYTIICIDHSSSNNQEGEKMRGRITKQKQMIISILKETDRPISINDIYNKIIDKLPRIAKFHFDENEIFYLYKGNDQEHSHFIVCHECKKFYTLPSCPIRELEDSIEAEGFIIKDHKFQISGICKNCSLNHLAN